MNIKTIIQKNVIKLKENNIDEANNKARLLLAFILGVSKEYLIINFEQEITPKQEKNYNNVIKQLLKGVPIQYILGKQEFMGIEFTVNKNVLIPQPDTEILVEETIKIAKQYKQPKILDLCTGSGAIAISILKNIPEAKITASDISKKALKIAKKNDKQGKIKFVNSDLFKNIKESFDIIVSNPPYIKTDEIKILSKEVQNEPIQALDGGNDGLYFYNKIINHAKDYLNKNGALCLEIGENQKEQVRNLLIKENCYNNIKEYKDYEHRDRVIICKKYR